MASVWYLKHFLFPPSGIAVLVLEVESRDQGRYEYVWDAAFPLRPRPSSQAFAIAGNLIGGLSWFKPANSSNIISASFIRSIPRGSQLMPSHKLLSLLGLGDVCQGSRLSLPFLVEKELRTRVLPFREANINWSMVICQGSTRSELP